MTEYQSNPEETGRQEIIQALEETLRQLDFEETPLMAELRGVTTDAMREGDPTTALTAYARYQEAGQELVGAHPESPYANLGLSISLASLLARRDEAERCLEAIKDCADDAYGQGLMLVVERLDRILENI